jgi:hypothetical protein
MAPPSSGLKPAPPLSHPSALDGFGGVYKIRAAFMPRKNGVFVQKWRLHKKSGQIMAFCAKPVAGFPDLSIIFHQYKLHGMTPIYEFPACFRRDFVYFQRSAQVL